MGTTAYSIKNVSAMLDGQPVSGLGDGNDAISVTTGSDVGTMIIGAGGDGIFSQSADESAEIKLKLQHTSPTHRLLMQKLKQQRAGRLLGFSFDLNDSGSNEGGTADQCFVSRAPDDTKGKEAQDREWTLVTANWTPNITR